MADRIEGRLVALRLVPGWTFAAVVAAAWARGDAVAPIAPDLPGPELDRALGQLRPAVLVDRRGATPLPDPAPVDAELALVVTTSGTTGRPKGVELTHEALEASAHASLDRLGAGPGDRWLCCLPLHHVAGLGVLVRSRVLGVPPAIHARFDTVAVAAERDVTLVSLVPTMLARLLDAGADVARFRAILLGGAAPPPGLLERARAAGAHVVTSYGMTETAGGCVYDGEPLDGVEVRVGADGAVSVRGPVLARGYRGLPGGLVRDGWLRTADRGAWTPDGRLQVTGRLDDVVVTGGENVAGGEVAALLMRHPAVADAAVVGRPDPHWGQRVVAVVVPADPSAPPDLASLRRFVAERAGAHKAPRELLVTDVLPRTVLGKPDLGALTRRVGDAGAGRSNG